MKLNDSGDGLRLLQEHLGHASFITTAKYRKIAEDEHRSWHDQLWNKPDKQEK
jgi:integrase/recombinase XerD